MSIEIEVDQMFTSEITEEVIAMRDTKQITVDAILTESVLEVQAPGGAIVEYRTQDFIVSAGQYAFGPCPSVPERRDRFRVIRNGKYKAFEAFPEPSIQHYSSPDGRGLVYQIHTKEVAA